MLNLADLCSLVMLAMNPLVGIGGALEVEHSWVRIVAGATAGLAVGVLAAWCSDRLTWSALRSRNSLSGFVFYMIVPLAFVGSSFAASFWLASHVIPAWL